MQTSSTITLETPAVFLPLDHPSRYKAAYGGRGSGKSWHFASMVVEHCLLHPGSRIVCIREIQKTLAQSAKALIEAKIQEFGVGHEFRVLFDRIETPGAGLISFIGMQDQNAEKREVTRRLRYCLGRGSADALSTLSCDASTDHPQSGLRVMVHLEPTPAF